MCVALIGGMDRLERRYRYEAAKQGFNLRVLTRNESNMDAKIRNADAIVIFTNMVSHNMKTQAAKEAKAKGIPVLMHHSCGVCTLRECLGCLVTLTNGKGVSGNE